MMREPEEERRPRGAGGGVDVGVTTAEVDATGVVSAGVEAMGAA